MGPERPGGWRGGAAVGGLRLGDHSFTLGRGDGVTDECVRLAYFVASRVRFDGVAYESTWRVCSRRWRAFWINCTVLRLVAEPSGAFFAC